MLVSTLEMIELLDATSFEDGVLITTTCDDAFEADGEGVCCTDDFPGAEEAATDAPLLTGGGDFSALAALLADSETFAIG